jgi:PAS domain S-box-containing protein
MARTTWCAPKAVRRHRRGESSVVEANGEIHHLLAQLVTEAEVAVLVADRDGSIRWANETAARQYGRSRRDLTGRPLSSLLAPAAAPLDVASIERAGGSWAGEQQHVRCNGAQFPVRTNAGLLRDAEGRTIGLAAILNDVSRDVGCRQRLASVATVGAALQGETELGPLLRLVCRETSGLFDVDRVELWLIDVPPDGEQLLRRVDTTAELDGQADPTIALDDPNAVVARAIREGHTVTRVAPPDRPTPSRGGPSATLAAPLRHGGRAFGALVAVREDRAAAFDDDDCEAAALFADLAAIAVERTRLLERERQAARLEGAIKTVRAVAHEVNQPLAAIMGHAELGSLKAEQQCPNFRSHLDEIGRFADELAGLVRRMQRLVRFEQADSLVVGPYLDIKRSIESREDPIPA